MLFGWFNNRSLSEILSGFERMRSELEQFYQQTASKRVDRQREIYRLTAVVAVQTEEMDKAHLVSENLKVLMSENLRAPQEQPQE